jgi:hypothetical protein
MRFLLFLLCPLLILPGSAASQEGPFPQGPPPRYQVSTLEEPVSGLRSANLISDLATDAGGVVWASNYLGIVRLDTVTDTLQWMVGGLQGISGEVEELSLDPSGVVWFSMFGGPLCRWVVGEAPLCVEHPEGSPGPPPGYLPAETQDAVMDMAPDGEGGLRMAFFRRQRDLLQTEVDDRTKDLKASMIEADQANRAKSTFLFEIVVELADEAEVMGRDGQAQVVGLEPDSMVPTVVVSYAEELEGVREEAPAGVQALVALLEDFDYDGAPVLINRFPPQGD